MKSNICTYVIDMGGTMLKGAVISNDTVVDEVFFVPANSSNNLSDIISGYTKMLNLLDGIKNKYQMEVLAMVISSPGPFDYQKGISHMKHKYQAIYEIDLKKLFKEELNFDKPIMFENDVIAFFLGEIKAKGLKEQNIAAITLGTGLGFVLMNDGKILRNPLGSPQLTLYDKPYLSGKMEDYFSNRGMVNIYHKLTNKDIASSLDIYNLAVSGDCEALDTLKYFGSHLGRALHPYLNENNVKTLIIGGQVSKSSKFFIDSLKETLGDIEVIIASEANATLIGLAALYK